MAAIDLPRPPAIRRAVLVQVCALFCGVMLSGLLSGREAKEAPPREAPKPKRAEKMIRVIKLPPQKPPELPKPTPQQKPPPAPPPPQARAKPPPSPPPAHRSPPQPSRSPSPPLSAEQTSVKGVPLRVLIPSDPRSIGAHLASSGGCLVVSRLHGDDAEPVATFGIESGRAVPIEGGPCNGVPRLLNSDSLNAALGDPVGAAARSSGETGPLALQIVLSPSLHDAAQSALAARFGRLGDEEMAAAAAREGYELRCYARAAGGVSCQ